MSVCTINAPVGNGDAVSLTTPINDG